jgi:hypothetical protein
MMTRYFEQRVAGGFDRMTFAGATPEITKIMP